MVHGYHVILGAYGFWLPNDPRGSCDPIEDGQQADTARCSAFIVSRGTGDQMAKRVLQPVAADEPMPEEAITTPKVLVKEGLAKIPPDLVAAVAAWGEAHPEIKSILIVAYSAERKAVVFERRHSAQDRPVRENR